MYFRWFEFSPCLKPQSISR